MPGTLICYNENGEKVYERLCAAAVAYLRLNGDAAVEFLFAEQEEIRSVNNKMRGIDKPTDVLSFPTLDKPLNLNNYTKHLSFSQENYPYDYDPQLKAVLLGSIIVCRTVAAQQAAEMGHSVETEEQELFLHGLLHLLGFDHETEADYLIMLICQSEILNLAEENVTI